MNKSASNNQARIVYFSHGGGPLPILGDPGHAAMVEFMRNLPTLFPRPDAIVVVSAHWEMPSATLLGAVRPPMYYDYYGFPDAAYRIDYPAPGSPELAARIAYLLRLNGVPSAVDGERGFDHGLFIPLKLMYPEADIPALQLSLLRGLNPAAHLALGRALRTLAAENILVIGSGFSFHNLRAFSDEPRPDPENDAFQDWLIRVCVEETNDDKREQALLEWERAPHARYCHPREEHLLPLHVCAALAARPARTVFDDYIFGKRAVAFLWE